MATRSRQLRRKLPVNPHVTENLQGNPQTESPLFKLPAELRNEIYSYTLYVPPKRFELEILLRSSQSKIPSVLALLQTCRQIRDEAQGLFYQLNNVEIAGNDLRSLVRDTRLVRLKRIEALGVYVSSEDEEVTLCFKRLAHLTGLKRLRVIRLASSWKCTDHREDHFMKKALAKCPKLETIRLIPAFECAGATAHMKKAEEELQGAIDRARAKREAGKGALDEKEENRVLE